MDRNKRASSAPLLDGKPMVGDPRLSGPIASDQIENTRPKLTARSPGCLYKDNSVDRVEFQDRERSMTELKLFAQTAPPDHISLQPILNRASMTALSRTDSGRRRRILQHISASGSLPSKPLQRLLGLTRSTTTSDLSQENIPRGSVEIVSRETSRGRKYMKIALNPKLYESENQSTNRVNELKVKGDKHRWVDRKARPRTKLESDTSSGSGQASSLLQDNDDYCKRVMSEYPHLMIGNEISEPVKVATKGINNGIKNGYSPSKGIPKPELGPNSRDWQEATLASAQANTRPQPEPVPKLLARNRSASRERRLSPVRKHASITARWKASSKGPHSVPIKLQMRPQRMSLPKTPRTSLEETSPVEDTSPVVNGKAVAASTASISDSIQSDAEPGEIMSAQSAEFFHGQGTFGHHKRKPPKPGPAPTRALPSLPEGRDGGTPQSIEVDTAIPAFAIPTTQSQADISPASKTPKSPYKGHRYRLSPVKNNVPKDALKPAAEITEGFPQPPRSFLPASPRKRLPTVSPRRDREVDTDEVRPAGQHIELRGRLEDATSFTPSPNHEPTSRTVNEPLPLRISSLPNDSISGPSPNKADTDKNNLYMPWQESRPQRVQALKARDIDRQRTRQHSAPHLRTQDTGSVHEPQESHILPLTAPAPTETRHELRTTSNAFSPVVTIASNPPSYIPPSPSTSHQNLIPPPLSTSNPTHPHTPFLNLPHAHPSRTPSPSSTNINPNQNQNRYSNASFTTTYSNLDAETRLAALERRCRLLEKAFLAVVEAGSLDFGGEWRNGGLEGVGEVVAGAAAEGEGTEK
ncbi:MAG: hypothetical protein Q9174_000843 [Haloplaca sp. 1 TL-2023]